jgi:hypothetical protein
MIGRWLSRNAGKVARSLEEVQKLSATTSKPLVLAIRHPSIKGTPYSFQQVYAKYSAENEPLGLLEGQKEDKLLEGLLQNPLENTAEGSQETTSELGDDQRWTLVTYELQQLSEGAVVFGLKKLPAVFLIKLGQIYDCRLKRSGRRCGK